VPLQDRDLDGHPVAARGALPDLSRQCRPASQVRHRPLLAEIDPTCRSALRQLLPRQVPSLPLPLTSPQRRILAPGDADSTALTRRSRRSGRTLG
jgi:hypothetical protein